MYQKCTAKKNISARFVELSYAEDQMNKTEPKFFSLHSENPTYSPIIFVKYMLYS